MEIPYGKKREGFEVGNSRSLGVGGRREKRKETERPDIGGGQETSGNWHLYLQSSSLGCDYIWTGPYEVIVSNELRVVKVLCKMKKPYK